MGWGAGEIRAAASGDQGKPSQVREMDVADCQGAGLLPAVRSCFLLPISWKGSF